MGRPTPPRARRRRVRWEERFRYGADTARSEALVREGLTALPEQPEFALDRVFCLQIAGAVSRARGDGGEAISRLQLAQGRLKEAPISSWRLEFLISLDLGNALRLAGRYREACTQFEQTAARLIEQGRGDTGSAASVYYCVGGVAVSTRASFGSGEADPPRDRDRQRRRGRTQRPAMAADRPCRCVTRRRTFSRSVGTSRGCLFQVARERR